jgi:CxxC-x17-CxxC domain-containing protein
MDFVDRELICTECRQTFVFSVAEQQFFKEKGFANDPKRCKQCKRSGVTAGRTETAVKCSECRKDTTVPFKPTGLKPVLCRACFQEARKALAAFRGDL